MQEQKYMTQEEFYKNLPVKRMGAGALIFNSAGQLLLVKPRYKGHWSIPGGIVEKDESPRQACLREVKEEIGIKLKKVKFLCVDWVGQKDGQNESLQFIFYGGLLAERQIAGIKIDSEEISEYRFVEPGEVEKLLGGPTRNLAKRMPRCLEAAQNNIAMYLEEGR